MVNFKVKQAYVDKLVFFTEQVISLKEKLPETNKDMFDIDAECKATFKRIDAILERVNQIREGKDNLDNITQEFLKRREESQKRIKEIESNIKECQARSAELFSLAKEAAGDDPTMNEILEKARQILAINSPKNKRGLH